VRAVRTKARAVARQLRALLYGLPRHLTPAHGSGRRELPVLADSVPEPRITAPGMPAAVTNVPAYPDVSP